MDVNFFSTRAHALVLKQREDLEAAYERHSEIHAFWAMVDLQSSTNFRIARGPKKGYVRGETFFSIVRAVIAPANEVHLLKEMGDAVLLMCRDFSPLFESILLIDHVAFQMAAVTDDPEFPFGIRSGINSGPAKKLLRDIGEDYLGRPIDELSRVMAVRSLKTNVLLHERAFAAARDVLHDYSSVMKASDSLMIPSATAKGASEPIFYREVLVNRGALGSFNQGFSAWRRTNGPDEAVLR
jgi:hypothetical protein